MPYDEITQLIDSVGFPIIACAAIFYQMNKQDKLHKEEMNKLNEALENNTIAIVKLTDKLNGGGEQ